jgi:regulatory protein
LDRAARSRSQLEAILERRGVPADAAAAVLDRFEEVGLVDDAALAGALVRTRHQERGLVGPALARELERKGIAREVALDAMAQVTEEDQAAAAERVARKRLAATAGLPREVRFRRAAAALARKGFPPGTAYGTVKRLLDAEPEEAP